MRPTEYFIGVNLGQAQDYTALAVVERRDLALPDRDPVTFAYKVETQWNLRHLERPPLGTPYPDVVDRTRTLVRLVAFSGRCEVVADATGVGAPVVDLMERSKLGAPVHSIVITGGDAVNRDGRKTRVPKRDLVSNLLVMLQNHQLRIAEGLPLAAVLVSEMLNFRAKINVRTGNDSYEAWREGVHDDLVLAVALACWHARPQIVARWRSTLLC